MVKKLFLAILVVIVLLFGVLIFSHNSIEENLDNEISEILSKSTNEKLSAMVSGDLMTDQSYHEKYLYWQVNNIPTPSDVIEHKSSIILDANNKERNNYSFNITVENAGLYEMNLKYLINSETRVNPTVGIYINGSAQYNEMNNLPLPVIWKPIENEELYNEDRYGNELSPRSEIDVFIQNQSLKDGNYFYNEPAKMYLQEGLNEIEIILNEGVVEIIEIKFENTSSSLMTYEEYLEDKIVSHDEVSDQIVLEAEQYDYKSKQSIRSKYVRNPQITPYDYKRKVLNVIDGESFSEPGDYLIYNFKVEQSGFYDLVIKYQNSSNEGIPTFRKIEINGEVPFKELENYRFPYTTTYKNETLKNPEGNPYKMYFEAGESYELKISINNSGVREIYQSLLNVLGQIEDINSKLGKITGGIKEKNRDWKLEIYFEDLNEKLLCLVNEINTVTVDLEQYLSQEVPIINELKIAAENIEYFTKSITRLNQLPGKLDLFSEGDLSAFGRINAILPKLLKSSMELDKIYVNSNMELPKANPNIFMSTWEEIKAFFYSFFDPRYNQSHANDEDTLNIWVNKSRLYIDMMQRMIDEKFTKETGIKVNLSLLSDENKIILANAAGKTPDGVISISHGKPFDLAIRGLVEDLSTYDGFDELFKQDENGNSQYNKNSFIPFIYDQGVYAIPETQDVKLLFYRKDILKNLNITEIPDTWDDVLNVLPTLQRYDKNFYTPIGGASTYKGFDTTLPFIYQFGGILYKQDESSVSMDLESVYAGFEFMTNLFTIYGVPQQNASFYQSFRSGTVPIGIGGVGEYIQLKYAAPELAGQWGVAVIPGYDNGLRDENGNPIIERWDPTYGTASIILNNSNKKDEAWELIKWWHSTETQSDFSYEIQSNLGSKFLYMSANIEAFKQSAWPSDSKNQILEQWKWIRSTGKVPGDYIVEREISDAFNKVVFDGKNPRVTFDDTYKPIKKELLRKLEEFGYYENHEFIKSYQIPSIYNIDNWINE